MSNQRDTHTQAKAIKGQKLQFPCIVIENLLLKGDRWQPKYKAQNATSTLLKCELHELLPTNLICHEI